MSGVESEPPYLYPAGVLAHGNLPCRKESGVELDGIAYPGRRKGRGAGKQGRERLGSQEGAFNASASETEAGGPP